MRGQRIFSNSQRNIDDTNNVIAAIDILDEVEAGATALNGEIVRRAFHGTCCDFFANQEEFRTLLTEYIRVRMIIHHATTLERTWRSPVKLDLGPRHYETLRKSQFESEDIRAQLKMIWPCAACIWLYNPTHRLRRFPQLAC